MPTATATLVPTATPTAVPTATPKPTPTPQATATPVPATRPGSPDWPALVALYNATGGASWKNNANWLSNRPLNQWHGITTDGNGYVTEMDLSYNELTGSLPAQLGNSSSCRI